MIDVVKSLEDVKVGDLFLIRENGYNQRLHPNWVYTLTKCEQVTAKQCVIREKTYRKLDAKLMGETRWNNTTLVHYSEEGRIAILRQKHINYLQERLVEEAIVSLSNENLEKTYNFFNEMEA